jgi:hypothetical protein
MEWEIFSVDLLVIHLPLDPPLRKNLGRIRMALTKKER